MFNFLHDFHMKDCTCSTTNVFAMQLIATDCQTKISISSHMPCIKKINAYFFSLIKSGDVVSKHDRRAKGDDKSYEDQVHVESWFGSLSVTHIA